jgi:PAS domain S-box-containing protein
MAANPIDVLLIEDSPGDARLIQEMLADARGAAFELERVDCLARGLDRVVARKPDVVLLDLGLPDAQGLEALRDMQQQAARVPVVVLTGLNDEDIAAQAVQEGAQDYLVKGQIDSSQLARAVRYAIERGRIRHQLQEAEERLRAVITSAPVIVCSTDSQGTITLCRGAGLSKVAANAADIEGRSIREVFPRIPAIAESFDKALGGEPVATMIETPQTAFQVSITPLRDERSAVWGAIGVATDITERVHAEEALHETLAELEGRNQELESFTYSVSHDLKEPLRTLEAFSQFLLEDYAAQLDEQGRDYLTRMGRAAARMKQMIEELLALSRLGRRPEELLRVDVGQVVANITAAFQIALEEKDARIDVAGGLPSVLGDLSRVEQIFGNLIANGMKFNRSERPVVTVGVNKIDDGAVTFSVRDNGIGIDPQYHDKIFGVFQRLHRREEYDGTGAGLAIVKRAAEALGGRVWLASAPDAGTTFFVSLPLWRKVAVAA